MANPTNDYQRINFNIKNELLDVVDVYCTAGYGRSALLNYLVAAALSSPSTVSLLDELVSKRKDND